MAAGNAQFCCADEPKAYEEVKRLLLCLPSNNLEDPPFLQNEDPADRPVTADPADVFAYARQRRTGNPSWKCSRAMGKRSALALPLLAE